MAGHLAGSGRLLTEISFVGNGKSFSFFVISRPNPSDRFSLLPELTLNGILHLRIFEGSINGENFKSFLEELLELMNPYPAHNSVLIMDNCAIHKVPGVRAMIAAK